MQRRTFWSSVCAVALLLWATLVALGAHAQSDSGDFQILQARYGTAEKNVDVTQQLKDLARRDRSFRLGNDTFGVDPDYGRVKSLRIYTRTRDGGNRTFEYREGQHVDGAQFTGWGSGNWGSGWNGGWGGGGGGGGSDNGQWQILQARYGTAERNIDVTPRLKELARRDRMVRLTNDLFGTDPHYGAVKTLRIYARNGNQNRTFEIREGDMVDGAQFSGWSSGNWGNGGWSGGWGGGGGSAGNGGRVTIVNAVYGAGRQTMDVTQRLRDQLRDGRLDVRADNALAGRDPAPQVEKTLRITYTVDGGRQQQVVFNENTQARLP